MKLLLICLFATVATTILAGSLTPPGPPAPTMKTLDEVEARTPIRASDIPLLITESGSYYLAENLTLSATDTTGILVSAPHATIDLNGYTLTGAGAHTGFFGDGISTLKPSESITVRNGTIRNCGGSGISTVQSQYNFIENVNAVSNFQGIDTTTGTIQNCEVSRNLTIGLIVNGTAYISGNNITHNGNSGLVVGNSDHLVITNNTCSFNGENGIVSFLTHHKITNNFCEANGGDGIACLSTSGLIDGNIVHANKANGINTDISLDGDSSVVVRNFASDNLNDYRFSFRTSFGPIVQLGFFGAPIPSEHPWANFKKP